MSHQTLLIAFAVCFLLNFAAFGMQRATLIISREADVPARIGEALLPSWFPVIWLVFICKWGLLAAVAFTWSWGIAIGLGVLDLILSAILPIPYRAYIPFFRKRVLQIKQRDMAAGLALEDMLNASKINSVEHIIR
jgi:hypothetical protein